MKNIIYVHSFYNFKHTYMRRYRKTTNIRIALIPLTMHPITESPQYIQLPVINDKYIIYLN